jgi:hypothetical protein
VAQEMNTDLGVEVCFQFCPPNFIFCKDKLNVDFYSFLYVGCLILTSGARTCLLRGSYETTG